MRLRTVPNNLSFPVLQLAKDELFYVTFYVAEGLAEVYITESKAKLERILTLRDSLLRKLAEIVIEDREIERTSSEIEARQRALDVLKARRQKEADIL